MRKLLVLGFVMAVLTACQTAVGPAGPAGADGTDGSDGNANVVQYEFGPVTFTGALNLTLEVDRATIDDSLLLVYYNPDNEVDTAWYAAPGIGSSGTYQTRTFWYQVTEEPSTYLLALRALNLDGSSHASELTFRAIRVFIVEASVITPGTAGTMDYRDVVAALGLEPIAP